MSKPKLFIGHSSKTEQNLAFLKSVCETLRQDDTGFHVLVDQSGEIPIGEEWFRYLSEWMAECDAAIILFSRAAAKESQWVRAESAILTWRKRIQPKFKLIGVLLDGLQPDDLENDEFFKVIRIADFQFVRGCQNEQEILDKVTARLSGLKTDPSPFEHLITLIREILENVNENALRRAWQSLDCPHKPPLIRSQDFADCLARTLFRDPDSVFIHLHNLLKELRNVLDEQRCVKMLEITRGFWVNSEAAGTLSWASSNHPAVVIQGHYVPQFTGPCYIRRSWPYPSEIVLHSADHIRTLSDLQNLLWQNLFPDLYEPGVEPDLELLGLTVEQYDPPIFVVYCLKQNQNTDCFPDQDLLLSIETYNGKVKFLIAIYDDCDDFTEYAKFIEPKLDSSLEKRQLAGYTAVKTLIARV